MKVTLEKLSSYNVAYCRVSDRPIVKSRKHDLYNVIVDTDEDDKPVGIEIMSPDTLTVTELCRILGG